MRVKAIMLPADKIACIEVNTTVGEGLRIIDEQKLLSLPVVNGREFIGVLSKQFLFEEYFKGTYENKEAFLQRPVGDFMKSTIESIPEDMRIEEAAVKFITSKVRFIPITDDKNNLMGIVTQQAVFRQYQKMFGDEYNTLVIYSYDTRGTLAKMCETVSKAGGDIRNMLVMHTDVMDLVEIFLRIDAADFDKVIKALNKHGFDVRDVKYAMENQK